MEFGGPWYPGDTYHEELRATVIFSVALSTLLLGPLTALEIEEPEDPILWTVNITPLKANMSEMKISGWKMYSLLK